MIKLYPLAIAFSVLDAQVQQMGGLVNAHHEFAKRIAKSRALIGCARRPGTHNGLVQTTMSVEALNRGLQLRNMPREHDRNQWVVLFSGMWTKQELEQLLELVVAWQETEDVDSLQVGTAEAP